jgi:hypothetical protein
MVMNPVARWMGAHLSRFLARDSGRRPGSRAADLRRLRASLRPGDVLLVEGHSRFSTAIKYLTQSTWSHAALYVGDAVGRRDAEGEPLCFVDADIVDGVRAVGFAEFDGLHARLCRPVSLRPDEAAWVVAYAVARIGHQYDLRNVIDLARYLLPTPPVPQRWRRRMLSLGSGDPTRAICSTLIAQAFQSVRYPILPIVERRRADDPPPHPSGEEILRARHHRLFVPRDFDLSPYFEVVKPLLVEGFDHHRLRWHDEAGSGGTPALAVEAGRPMAAGSGCTDPAAGG